MHSSPFLFLPFLPSSLAQFSSTLPDVAAHGLVLPPSLEAVQGLVMQHSQSRRYPSQMVQSFPKDAEMIYHISKNTDLSMQVRCYFASLLLQQQYRHCHYGSPHRRQARTAQGTRFTEGDWRRDWRKTHRASEPGFYFGGIFCSASPASDYLPSSFLVPRSRYFP